MARTNIVFIIVAKLIALLSEDAPSRQQLVELSSRTSYSVLGRPCYIYISLQSVRSVMQLLAVHCDGLFIHGGPQESKPKSLPNAGQIALKLSNVAIISVRLFER